MLALRILFLIAVTGTTLLPSTLTAQVIELAGGASTLYDSQGGDLTIHTRSYDFTGGIGFVDGHLLEGTHTVRPTSFGQMLAGDFRLPFRLPTDIFDSSHYLLTRGIGARILHPTSEIVGFAGVTSLEYSSPFFEGAQGNDPAGILMVAKTVRRNLDLFSDTVLARKITQLAAVNWTPLPKVHLAFAGGVGTNAPYAAASAQVFRPRYDVQAAYFAAGSQFQRAFVPSPFLAEPTGSNLLLTVRPARFLSVGVSHQEFLVPINNGADEGQSKVDEGTVGMRVLGAQVNANLFSSTYARTADEVLQNRSVSLTALRNIGSRYQVNASYLANRPLHAPASESMITNLSETVNARITVTENVTVSNGTANVNFGGTFLSNLLEFSAGYDTFYVPSQNNRSLQQSLILDAKLNLFGKLVLHGSSVVDPTGKLRYTLDAKTLLFRSRAESIVPDEVPMGDYVVSGRVLTVAGVPIDGAALQIDGAVLYTDSEGRFLLRENHLRMHSVKVLLTEFLNEGHWEVISDPGPLPSILEARQTGSAVIVLQHPRLS